VSEPATPEGRLEPPSGADTPTEVDARGLACPMPVIELAKAVRTVDVGQVVRLYATDPAARVDVPVWCRMQRQALRSQDETDGVWRFDVERVR
jgi:tRNA 2-thiouridine synthesizing protein A